MKKFTVFALICVFALEACQAINNPNNPAPNVDTAGTVNAIAQTAFAQTLTAQPSPTAVPPTFTSSPTPVLAEPSATPTLVNTDTPVPNLTASATATLVLPLTATNGTASGATPTAVVTATATLASNQPTASATLGIRTYGTLPPQNRPYTEITITNKSRAEAYISLQVVTDQGYTIIEYPVERSIRVSIPTGDYTYVVWVGGRKFVGYFHASQFEEPSITIFRDRIVVN